MRSVNEVPNPGLKPITPLPQYQKSLNTQQVMFKAIEADHVPAAFCTVNALSQSGL